MPSSKIKIGIVFLAIVSVYAVAIFLILEGVNSYNSIQVPPTLSELEGFALFSSADLDIDYYRSLMRDIDTSKKSTGVTLSIRFSTKSSTDENVIMVAQNPCDLEILENSKVSAVAGGYWLFKPNIKKIENKTYFWYEFKAERDSEYIITFNLNWENYLSQISYSRFNLVIPIDLSLLPPTEFNALGFDITPTYRITPDIPNISSVSVHLPPESTNIYMVPFPDTITYHPENVWYIWDMKSRSDPDKYVSTAISIDFESSHLLDEKESELFLAGVFIAVGVGMITSLSVSLVVNYSKRD